MWDGLYNNFIKTTHSSIRVTSLASKRKICKSRPCLMFLAFSSALLQSIVSSESPHAEAQALIYQAVWVKVNNHQLCTHNTRAGGLLQLACLRNTERLESLCVSTVSLQGLKRVNLAYRASRCCNLASVLRETGGLDHKHPHLLIGWRIGHLQLQVDTIHLTECQRLQTSTTDTTGWKGTYLTATAAVSSLFRLIKMNVILIIY